MDKQSLIEQRKLLEAESSIIDRQINALLHKELMEKEKLQRECQHDFEFISVVGCAYCTICQQWEWD